MIESVRPISATSSAVILISCGEGAFATSASRSVSTRAEIPEQGGTCHDFPHARSEREAAISVRAASSV